MKLLKVESEIEIERMLGQVWYLSGADPGFSNKAGAKDNVHAAHIQSAECEVPYGPGSWKLWGFIIMLSHDILALF